MSKVIASGICLMVILAAVPAYAAPLESYLNDTLDTAYRVEVIIPEHALSKSTKEMTLWEKFRRLMGSRETTRIRPPVGTKFTVQSSAYAPSPYQTDSTPCVTAAGTRVRPGVVATNFLPMGTILEINGEKYIVEDRMNPRYNGYYLDIWFGSTSSALEFGRRNLEITIIDYGEPGDNIRGAAWESSDPGAHDVELTQESEIEGQREGESDESFWERLRTGLASLTTYLGSRADVNRYDVDCLAEEAEQAQS